MTHEIIRHLLDDYVSGGLDPEASNAVRNHVETCSSCSAELEGLKRVLSSASQLPRSIDPPAAAWSNIRSAIVEEMNTHQSSRKSVREFVRRRPIAAAVAAAVMVAILSSGGTAMYMIARANRTPDTGAARLGDPTVPATLAAFTVEENNYLRTASSLQEILDRQESALAPETVAQLKASLRTIDEAILEARGALARDPANKMLIEMLSANYKQKVDLLRRSSEMTRGS